MNKDLVYKKLLCYGLFPNRVRGILSSEQFGNWVINNESNINISPKERFSLLSYKLTRNNNAPRQMGIPHPLSFINLNREISKNWD